ncbi:MAG: hypothetical protein PHC51_08240 [bacterium]|nr:hypothetical protein [bacterium]
MRIFFEPLPDGYFHAINREEVEAYLTAIDPAILARVRQITFKGNLSTTGEGRIIQRGDCCEINVNFFVDSKIRTRIVSKDKSWLVPVRLCGGDISSKDPYVIWDRKGAMKYAMFLIFHEIAHIAYSLHIDAGGNIKGFKSSVGEERWCDRYALDMLAKMP